MKIYIFLVGILLVAAGCSTTQQAVNVQNQTQNQIPKVASPNPYQNIIYLGESFPGKYQCGNLSITTPPSDATTKDITLMPSGKLLLQIVTKTPSYNDYDVTFSKDCSQIYYTNTLENAALDNSTKLHVFNISSGKDSVITIPNSVFPSALMMQLDKKYYPILTLLYPIDNSHLLLSFENPTTGRDAAANQTSQAIFDINSQKTAFISGSYDLPILLNYGTNTLIAGEYDNNGMVAKRVEINLISGAQNIYTLKTPYQFPIVECDKTDPDYNSCRTQRLDQLLAP